MEPRDSRTPELSTLSPMVLADLMLLEVLARGRGALLLEPSPGESGYQLLFDGGGTTAPLAEISAPQAQATLARLAIIAGTNVRST